MFDGGGPFGSPEEEDLSYGEGSALDDELGAKKKRRKSKLQEAAEAAGRSVAGSLGPLLGLPGIGGEAPAAAEPSEEREQLPAEPAAKKKGFPGPPAVLKQLAAWGVLIIIGVTLFNLGRGALSGRRRKKK